MTDRLCATLKAEQLHHFLANFTSQGVTDTILCDLTDSDLKDLGIEKLGERRRLLAAFRASSFVAPTTATGDPSPEPIEAPVAVQRTAPSPKEATKQTQFINSLGMPFVPIPRFETRFCIWPVRVQDYEAYCMASGAAYPQVGFQQDSDHPIVSVSWNDAIEFCVWLTGKERAEGRIDDKTVYRLPTDLEWSAAVGLLHEPEATPEARSGKAPGYPWGLRWPPPKGAGNYAQTLEVDSFEHTSPVESFSANAFGLYDMGGNVWEWCMDWLNADKTLRVVRGASWNLNLPERLLSSRRGSDYPGGRDDYGGFRCVLVGESSR